MATRVKKGGIKKRYPAQPIEGRDLSNTIFKKWIQIALDLMDEGYSTSYIREHIAANKEGSVKQTAIDAVMANANEKIAHNQFLQRQEVTALHLKRYNMMIKELLAVEELPYPDEETLSNNEYAFQDWLESRNKKIRAYNDCIQTMFQKEDLLQYHNKGFVINVNVEEEITIKDERPKIDISQLTLQEQVELYQLIKKARKDDFELIGVIQNTTAGQDETIDVVAEVVETKPNIEHIAQLPIPEKPYISPVTQFDPTAKLRETLRKLAAKKIEDAGGHLDNDEKKHLN
jgi:hypothetical protein